MRKPYYDREMRDKVLAMYREGMTGVQISKRLFPNGPRQNTISRWILEDSSDVRLEDKTRLRKTLMDIAEALVKLA